MSGWTALGAKSIHILQKQITVAETRNYNLLSHQTKRAVTAVYQSEFLKNLLDEP